MSIFRKFASKKNSKVVIGESSDSYSIPGEGRRYDRANGRIIRSWKGPESFKSLDNMLLMSASPTSSQLNVHSIITLEIPLRKVLILFLGIIPLRCSLIYMLKPVRYH